MGGVGPKLEAPGEYRCPAAASAWRVVVSVHIGTSARCLSQLVCESSDNESWWSARGSFGSTRWSHRIALRIKCRSCRWITHPPPPPPHPTPPHRPRPATLSTGTLVSNETSAKMSWSGLEVIGFIVTVYVLWCLVSAFWNLLYTCCVGSTLGRAINVRGLGSWAGTFISSFYSYFFLVFREKMPTCFKGKKMPLLPQT